jgi:hypothetical protein
LAAIGEPDALSKTNGAAASLKRILAELIEHGASRPARAQPPDVSLTPEVQAHGNKAITEGRQFSLDFNKAVE